MPYHLTVSWKVNVSKTAVKHAKKLPKKVRDLFEALLLDLTKLGPNQREWANYSKLGYDRYHCHLNYSFVAVWKVMDNEIQILEVTYVGSREDAPY